MVAAVQSAEVAKEHQDYRAVGPKVAEPVWSTLGVVQNDFAEGYYIDKSGPGPHRRGDLADRVIRGFGYRKAVAAYIRSRSLDFLASNSAWEITPR